MVRALVTLLVLHLGTASGMAQTDHPAPLHLAVGPHLFLDDTLVTAASNATRTVYHPARLPQPVVTGPEDKCFQPYVTVMRDPATGRFRIWYGVPEDASRSHLGYMESLDGVHWIRPHRVLVDPAPIQFGVSILDDGSRAANPQQRYKSGWWYGGGLQVAASPDGLTWKPLAPGVVLAHNHDIDSIHWDPIRKRYLALVSVYTTGPAWRGERRIPNESVSDDLVHWRKPWVVIAPDSKDDGETQFYCMSGVLARGDLLAGLVKVLRDEVRADNAPPGGSGIGYTTLAWSRDGERWNRDRDPFLERNPVTGSWDHAMTWGDCQLVVGREVFIYYGGYARGHKVERFTERQIGLARMPLDRYVSYEAGDTTGTLETPLVVLDGARLTVNAATVGELRARLVDADGRAVRGFDWRDSPPIHGDSIAHPVRWKHALSTLGGRPVRVQFRLRRARIWSFDLAPDR